MVTRLDVELPDNVAAELTEGKCQAIWDYYDVGDDIEDGYIEWDVIEQADEEDAP